MLFVYVGVECKILVVIPVQYCGKIAICDSYMYTNSVHFYNIGIYHPFLIF